MKTFAVVDNGIVINVIIADDNFAQAYTASQELQGSCHSYEEVHEDDDIVARIGDSFIDGKFITPIPEVPKVTSITKIQAMRQLKSMNLWTQFQEVLASNQDAMDEWTLALSLEIDDPFSASLLPALGITIDQLQILFDEASLL